MKPGRPTTEPGTFEFRPRSGRLVGIGWAIVAAAWIVVAARDGWSTAIASIPIICLTSVAVYALFIRPKVCVGPTKVVLVNVIRDVTIPLQILARVDTQYALTLTTTDGKRYQAWAAPAGGRLGAARMTEEERRSLTWSGPEQDIPSSAALRSDAGAAAAAIRRSWDPQRNPELVRPHDPAHVHVRWATGILVAFVVSAMATLVVALV